MNNTITSLDKRPNNDEQPRLNRVDAIATDLLELNSKLCVNDLLMWKMDDSEIKLPDLINKIWCHRSSQLKPNIAREHISMVLNDKVAMVRRRGIADARANLIYDPNAKDTFEEVTRILTGPNYDEQYPIILKHIVWTVKRRFYRNLDEPFRDYCPIFVSVYGAAGKGKTEAIRAFFSVIPSYLIDVQRYSDVLFKDDRHTFRFVDYYVCVMDELCGLNKADINNIKNTIDAIKHIYRVLGLNATAEGYNNAQLIGTSNTRLRNTLKSDIGSDIRKWAEIDIAQWPDDEVPSKLVEPLQKFDWVNLWRSVNEKGPSPFHDANVYASFKAWTSKKCKHDSPTSLYIDELLVKHAGKWASKLDCYDGGYLNTVTEFPKSWSSFKEDLEKQGCIMRKKTTGIGFDFPPTKNGLITFVDDEPEEVTPLQKFKLGRVA